MLQSRKFYIFQRALRRYVRTGMYYSKAVPLAKEFTIRVVARWERLALEAPATNFSLENSPLALGFALVLEQQRKDFKLVTDYAASVPFPVRVLLPYYVTDCKRDFELFDKCVKYACVNGKPLVTPHR